METQDPIYLGVSRYVNRISHLWYGAWHVVWCMACCDENMRQSQSCTCLQAVCHALSCCWLSQPLAPHICLMVDALYPMPCHSSWCHGRAMLRGSSLTVSPRPMAAWGTSGTIERTSTAMRYPLAIISPTLLFPFPFFYVNRDSNS